MTDSRRRPGPRLSTKLTLLALVLLSIPWLGYRYLIETKNFLLEGQAQAQLLTAKGIALTLQSNENLFNDLPVNLTDYSTLTTYPLDYPIRVDGYSEDWREIVDQIQFFGGTSSPRKLGLVLGVTASHLYAFLQIEDSTPLYRHPGYRRLDNSDHLRLSFATSDGSARRLVLTMEGPGSMTGYDVDSNWLYAETGQPEYDVSAFIRDTGNGYLVEMRLPLTLLGPQKRLGLSYADVTDAQQRQVTSVTSTLPQIEGTTTNLVLLRSPQIEKVIRELSQSDTRIWIIDRQQRVRATAGNLGKSGQLIPDTDPADVQYLQQQSLWQVLADLVFQRIVSPASAAFTDFDSQTTSQRNDQVIARALSGSGGSSRRLSLDGRAQILASAFPIYENGEAIGAVLLEQSTSSILALQRQSLEKIVMLTALSLLAIVLSIAVFTFRLTWRVKRMRRETQRAIDPHGRLMVDELQHEIRAGDEIGDLARSVSQMLSRLHQYQSFVANIPKTLRHEINNPLNTISTSLENLSGEPDPQQQQLYVKRARRGLHQIGVLVQQLAESASLEQALANEEMEPFNLCALLQQYLNNYQQSHDVTLEIELPYNPVWISGADFRIEQLMDKLMDNALDFNTGQQPVKVRLTTQGDSSQIQISNYGTVLAPYQIPLIFNQMSSTRRSLDSEKIHLGLGLYISRLIVNYHNGRIGIANIANSKGVTVTIHLPICKEYHSP